MQLQQQDGDERADDGAQRVQRAMKAEGHAAFLRPCAGGDQRVARRGTHALAEAVDETADEGDRPDESDGEYQLADGGQTVAGRGKGAAAAGEVRPLAKGVTGDARRRLGDALDEAQDGRRGAQHPGDEVREERIDHLGAEVGEEAHQTEAAHVAVQQAHAAPAGAWRTGLRSLAHDGRMLPSRGGDAAVVSTGDVGGSSAARGGRH